MATGRRRQQEPASNFIWMLFGLALGLLVALVVYLQSNRGSESPAAAAVRPAPAATAAENEPEPAREDGFDFYDELPQFEVVIPEVESAPRRDAPVRAVEEPGRYVLQVGSFTTLGDADRMQASLALIGIESRIQRVTIDDAVFHRVRIGPIADLEALNQIRRRLHDADIEWLLMQVSDQ